MKSVSIYVVVIFALLLSLLGSALTVTPAHAASLVVNSNADSIANDGVCTLREAIIAANTDTASGAAAGECSPVPAQIRSHSQRITQSHSPAANYPP